MAVQRDPSLAVTPPGGAKRFQTSLGHKQADSSVPCHTRFKRALSQIQACPAHLEAVQADSSVPCTPQGGTSRFKRAMHTSRRYKQIQACPAITPGFKNAMATRRTAAIIGGRTHAVIKGLPLPAHLHTCAYPPKQPAPLPHTPSTHI
eukprot:365826-Chlamydomonas_euryale.AAC.15